MAFGHRLYLFDHKAQVVNYCWSCHHEAKMGISLDDSEEVHVCDKCWAKIPIVWRLIVTRYFRQGKPDMIRSLFDSRNSTN